MPIAWFTFWKSTWGTRMTPADVAERERKKNANKEAQPQVAGPAEEMVQGSVPAVPVEKEEGLQVILPVLEANAEESIVQPAVEEKPEIQMIQPAAQESVAETADIRTTEEEAGKEEKRRSFTDDIFNKEAMPYVDPRLVDPELTVGATDRMYDSLSDDLAKEQQALIELIRENQKQVSELRKLMEQRIELEKMRIAAYQNARAEYYREESSGKQEALRQDQEEDKP